MTDDRQRLQRLERLLREAHQENEAYSLPPGWRQGVMDELRRGQRSEVPGGDWWETLFPPVLLTRFALASGLVAAALLAAVGVGYQRAGGRMLALLLPDLPGMAPLLLWLS